MFSTKSIILFSILALLSSQAMAMTTIHAPLATAQCKEALKPDVYEKSYQKISEHLANSPLGPSYSNNKVKMSSGADFNDFVNNLATSMNSFTGGAVRVIGSSAGVDVKEAVNTYVINTEAFNKADAILKEESMSHTENPLATYQAKQRIAEYFAKNQFDIDSYMRAKRFGTPKEIEDAEDSYEELLDRCVNDVAAGSTIHAKKTVAEYDNRQLLSQSESEDISRANLRKYEAVIIPPSGDQRVICQMKSALGVGNKSPNCDIMNEALNVSDGKDNHFTSLMSLFTYPEKGDATAQYMSKKYCSDCVGDSFAMAAALGKKDFQPKSDLGKSIINDIHDTRSVLGKIFQKKNKKPSKERAKKSWGNIRNKFKEKLTYNLVSKKVQAELAKTTEMLQQFYHVKSRIPATEEYQKELDQSFSCYDMEKITAAIKKSCGDDDTRIKAANEALEKSFGSFLGENYGGFLEKGFDGAFKKLHDLTANASKSKDGPAVCEKMSREEYSKAQNLRFEENGMKSIADHFLNIAMDNSELVFNLKDPKHVASKANYEVLQTKFENKEISPLKYMSEMFAYQMAFNPKNQSSLLYLALEKDNLTDKDFQKEKENILAPLTNGIIPLKEGIKSENGGLNFEMVRSDLSLLMMDYIHKMGTVNPNYYALAFDRDAFTDFQTGVKANFEQGKKRDFSALYLEYGDGKTKNKYQMEIDRFAKMQEGKCKGFIDNIAKYSCTETGKLSNFSRKDIDNELKDMSNKNQEGFGLTTEDDKKYESNLIDIALGSLSCEYKALLDDDTPTYKGSNQIIPLDDEVHPLAQSDLNARNRNRLGLLENTVSQDYLSDFASSEPNCSQREFVADIYDCNHNLGDGACGDISKSSDDLLAKQEELLKQSNEENLEDANERSALEGQIDYRKNIRTIANDSNGIAAIGKQAITSGTDLMEGQVAFDPDKMTDNTYSWSNDILDIDGNPVTSPDITGFNPTAYETAKEPDVTSDDDFLDVLTSTDKATTSASRSIATSNFPTLEVKPLDMSSLITTPDRPELVLNPVRTQTSFNDSNDKGDAEVNQGLTQTITSGSALANQTNTSGAGTLVDSDLRADIEPFNREIASIDEISEPEFKRAEVANMEEGLPIANFNEANILKKDAGNNNGRSSSNYQTIQPNQYSGNQFIADPNANPNDYNETIVDANGNEYVRKKPNAHRNDYQYLEKNTNALGSEFNNVKNDFAGDEEKISEIEKMEKRYKKLLAKKIEALKTEVDDIKTKTETPIKEEETISDNEIIVPSGGKTKKVVNTGDVTGNIQTLGTNTGTAISTTGSAGGGSNNPTTTTNFSESNTKRGSNNLRKNAAGKSSRRRVAGSGGRPVSISANAISSGDKASVSEQLNGYLKLVKNEGGSAIEQSQLIDIEYIEIPGKVGKIPHAVLIDEEGSPLKVPLDEEHVDKKVIKRILKAHEKISKNAQEEHERILEQEVFLESLKKEIAVIQAQAAADLNKLKETN